MSVGRCVLFAVVLVLLSCVAVCMLFVGLVCCCRWLSLSFVVYCCSLVDVVNGWLLAVGCRPLFVVYC